MRKIHRERDRLVLAIDQDLAGQLHRTAIGLALVQQQACVPRHGQLQACCLPVATAVWNLHVHRLWSRGGGCVGVARVIEIRGRAGGRHCHHRRDADGLHLLRMGMAARGVLGVDGDSWRRILWLRAIIRHVAASPRWSRIDGHRFRIRARRHVEHAGRTRSANGGCSSSIRQRHRRSGCRLGIGVAIGLRTRGRLGLLDRRGHWRRHGLVRLGRRRLLFLRHEGHRLIVLGAGPSERRLQVEVGQQLRCRGPLPIVVLQALLDEAARLLVEDLLERRRLGALGDLPIDLRGVEALRVGVLRGDHLEDAHPEGVDVHLLVVTLIVQLRRHELGRAKHGLGLYMSLAHERGEAEVANLDFGVVAVDENVVALQIAVDDSAMEATCPRDATTSWRGARERGPREDRGAQRQTRQTRAHPTQRGRRGMAGEEHSAERQA